MRALIALCAAVALVGSGVVVVRVQQEVSGYRPGWTLVLEDDFDGGALDSTIWNVQDTPSPRNNELQHYSPGNVTVDGGRLLLDSRRQPKGGRDFTSGAVDTYGKFAATHGRVEISAKLPVMGQGIWPALWMLETGCNPLGQPCPWPTRGAAEIDIAEAVGSPSTLYTNLHHGDVPGTSLSPGPEVRAGLDLAARDHTFAVEWGPAGAVRWFLDDELLAERSAPGHLEQPMYLIMNTAVGGDWPGPPDESTPFPQRFEIDRVRVYERR